MEQPVFAEEINLMDYLNVIWKRKWLIIIPTFLLMVFIGVISFLLPPQWEVDAIIVPSKFLIQDESGRFEEVLIVEPRQIAGQINQKSYDYLIAAELSIAIEKFPELKAENIRDTKLVQVSLKENDVEKGKRILNSLFNHLKNDLNRKIDVELNAIDTQISSIENAIKQNRISIRDLENRIELKKLQIKDKENDIKTRENEIKKQVNNIQLRDLDIKSREIEKDRINKEIESLKNKLGISEDRVTSIMEEMKAVKTRIDELDIQQRKALEEKKQGIDAISLLLYSNEVQQNLRYLNTLDEKLSNEKITQENINLSMRDKEEQLRQIDNQIQQIATHKDTIQTEIDNIKTAIETIKNEIDKIKNEIKTVENDIEKIKNTIANLEREISWLNSKKARIDYAQLIKEPTSSLNPVSPKKRLNVMIAAVVGAFMFTMLAFFVEYVEKQKAGRRD